MKRKNKFKAFTLAELMIVMLILAIVLACMAPIMTQRNRANSDATQSPWKYTEDFSNAYFIDGNSHTAMFGQKTLKDSDGKPAILIKKPDENNEFMFFKLGDSSGWHLNLGKNLIHLGTRKGADIPAEDSNNIVIGFENIVKDGARNNFVIGRNQNYGSNDNGNISMGNYSLNNVNENNGRQYNIALGHGSLQTLKEGSDNVVLGQNAGSNLTKSIGNTFIGSYAGKATKTGSNNVYIGRYAGVKQSNTGILSGNEEGNYNVAIGSFACQHVTGGDNNVCIGRDAGPNPGGVINDTIHIGSNQKNVAEFYVGPETLAQFLNRKYSITSDRRAKYVGPEFNSGLDAIKQLKVYNYTFKKDETKTPRVGVMAQDLQKVFPNAVKKGSDGFLTIRKEDMFYAVINAIKELDKKITKLFEENIQLKKENKELREMLKKQDERLKQLEEKIK